MKKLFSVVALVIVFSMAGSAQAQFGKAMKKAVGAASEKKAEEPKPQPAPAQPEAAAEQPAAQPAAPAQAPATPAPELRTSMAKPGMTNAKLEQDLMNAIKDEGWTEVPLKAVITDKEWTINRHEISGLILSRTLYGEVAVKTEKGACRVFEIGIVQDHDGANYGRSKYHAVGGSYEIDCKAVEKK